MTSFVRRAVSALRSWLGRPAAPQDELPMTPAHGWLLPSPAVLGALKASAPKDAPSAAGGE